MDNIAIIGYGITGKATGLALGISEKHGYDRSAMKNRNFLTHYDTFILCLPTPTKLDGTQDISTIEYWMAEIAKKNPKALVILRSTVLPGTTQRLAKEHNISIAHVPEFLTEKTAVWDARNPNLFVIGADDVLVGEKVKHLFLEKVNFKNSIMTNTVTSEFIKYAMNAFFALKVVYANELWDACDMSGARYDDVRQAMELHKWGSVNGWDVWHRGKRGYGGRCLPKDTHAFIKFFGLPLLKTMMELNADLTQNTKPV